MNCEEETESTEYGMKKIKLIVAEKQCVLMIT